MASGDIHSPTGGLTNRYATALYALADERGAIDTTIAELERLDQTIAASADLRRLINSPLIDVRQATRAITAVLDAAGFAPMVRNFVGVIAANRRLAALPSILRAFAALVARKRGVVAAAVTTAHPLSEIQRQQLRARLIEAGYGMVDLQETVDPSLLGGLILRIGARLFDSSLRARLQRLHYAMKGAA